MAIALKLKDSYPMEEMRIADLRIVKYEARTYSRTDEYLRKIASRIPAILILEMVDKEDISDDSTVESLTEINEMVTPESISADVFIEETKNLEGDINKDGKVDVKDIVEVIKNIGRRTKKGKSK